MFHKSTKKGTVFVMSTQHSKTDVILIGGGIMSATLGTLLKELTPDKEIKVFEKLNQPGEESSMYGIMLVQGIQHYVS